MRNCIVQGNALDVLKLVPDCSVDVVVTSPPYWMQRNYGVECEVTWPDGWRGQLGLEPSVELYVQHLVMVFHQVHRVLKPSGSLWLNLGDTYYNRFSECAGKNAGRGIPVKPKLSAEYAIPKQKLLIPERVALALQSDGWILRNDLVWHKQNPMPESVTDRFTRSWEHVYFFTKSADYFFNRLAARGVSGANHHDMISLGSRKNGGNHFSVMNRRLVEFIINVACPPLVCKSCGQPRKLTVVKESAARSKRVKGHKFSGHHMIGASSILNAKEGSVLLSFGSYETVCECVDRRCEAGLVVDPFCGVGTVPRVAKEIGVRWGGIEVVDEYARAAVRNLLEVIE